MNQIKSLMTEKVLASILKNIQHSSNKLVDDSNIKDIFLEMDDLFGDVCKNMGDIKNLTL
ncbi:hypothetical protein LXN10_13990 [Arcobacter sp. KX21116]|uniref:hypothetical protein n=1 Tax=Arcobacter iocasae TaxID=2906515 RepID=UPI0035D45FA4